MQCLCYKPWKRECAGFSMASMSFQYKQRHIIYPSYLVWFARIYIDYNFVRCRGNNLTEQSCLRTIVLHCCS